MASKKEVAEGELIERCLTALEELTALERWSDPPVQGVGEVPPGPNLQIRVNGEPFNFTVETCLGLKEAHVGPLAHRARQIAQDGGRMLLCADRVPDARGVQLREAGVNYADLSGNAHLRAPGLYVLVQGRRALQERVRGTLKGTEVRLLGVFLRDPDAGDLILQELGERAGIALGAVGRARTRLEEVRVLTRMDKRRWRVTDRATGLKLFANGWAAVVRPKLNPKGYRALPARVPGTTMNDALASGAGDLQCLLGGEGAAAALTGGLFTEHATLHLASEHRPALARLLGLVPDRNGPITMLDRYGRGDDFSNPAAAHAPPLIHPLLAWAECLTVTDERVALAADTLRRHYLEATP